MPDQKKLAEKFRSLASVPPPAVEVPAAVVPSTPAPKPEPVAAPAPTPTAALPTAPTAKTPVAARPKVRKPAAPKPLVIDLKQTPTTEQALRAATPKPIIAPAEAERVVAQQRVKEEKKAAAEAATAQPVEQVSARYGREAGEVLSGDYYTESKSQLKNFYSLMPVIAREAQAQGKTLTPEQVRREAARRTMFYTPVASSLLKKQATPGSVFSALGAVPEAASTLSNLDKTVDEKLVDLQKREDFVKERERMAADPLTNRLVKEMNAQFKKFGEKRTTAIPAKLVSDFERKYIDAYMTQNEFDKITDEKERKAKEAEGALKAREALDNLRAIGNPVVTAGLGAVTSDTVRAAAQEGFVPMVKEISRTMLPQQVVTASGAAVRTESIPMTILRDIDIPNALVSGFIPLPGERGRTGYRGDPFLRVQTGQTLLPDVLENQWFRDSIDGKNGNESRAAAAGLLASAAAFEIFMPGLEGGAAVGVAAGAKGLGRVTDGALKVADAIKVARNGRITTAAGVIPIKELPSIVDRTVQTVKRAKSTLATAKDPESAVRVIADSNLERLDSGDGFLPGLVNLEMDASSPALARVYRDQFLVGVGEDARLNSVLDIIKEDLKVSNKPADEFSILAHNDAEDLRSSLDGMKQNISDSIDSVKSEREAARIELDRLERTPTTPDVQTARNNAKKKYSELSSDLTKLEKKKARIDSLDDFTEVEIAASLQRTSQTAVERMLGERFFASAEGFGAVAPAATRVPSTAFVDIEDVRRAFGGELVTTDEAQRMASVTTLVDLVKNKSARTATEAEKRLAEQLVNALEGTDAAVIIDRLARAEVTDPFEILRALNRVDPEIEASRAAQLEDAYDKIVRKQVELEVEVNSIIDRNIAREEAAVQLDQAQRQYEDALRVAEQSSKDLKRARSIKVPKAAVEALRAERAALRAPAPGLAVTAPDAVRTASTERIASEIAPEIATDSESVPAAVAGAASSVTSARVALRENVSNPTMRRLIELRHGTDRTMPFAVTGEPWQRPDILMNPRPSLEGLPPASREHSLKLHRERTFKNNVKFVMQDGEALRKRMRSKLKEMEAEANPMAEEFKQYIESGSDKNDASKAQFAERMGVPTVKDYQTLKKAFDEGGFDEVYRKFDEIAAANPDAPRARGENVYYRWLLNRSAPDGMDPGVVRMDDYVEVRNPEIAARAGLIPQHVVNPDGTVTFMSGGFRGDRFMGRVVGAVEREGKVYAVVNVHQYGPDINQRAFPMTGNNVEVPMEEMILYERGRTPHVRFGPDGGRYPELRPMLESEWSEMFAREDAAFGNLKGKGRYAEDKNAHVYGELNPPKRPTIDDFDFFTEEDLRDAVDRQIPLPRMEMVDEAVDRPTLVPSSLDVLEERPTERVFVMGRPPAEPKAAAAPKPLTARDRRVGRMKIDAVNAAVGRRSDALELLEQRRAAMNEARAATGKIENERIQKLEQRIAALDRAKDEMRARITAQQQMAAAAADLERVKSETIEAVLAERRAIAQRLTEARDATQQILREERVIAKQAGEVGREPVSLQRKVQEETRRIAASEGGLAELIRGVRRLGGSARETVEGTLSTELRQVIRRIDRNRAEAEQLIRDGITAQGSTSPNSALIVMLGNVNDSRYGQAWLRATANETLNARAVESAAFAYVDDPSKLTKDQRDALKSIVTSWEGDLNGLAEELDRYSFEIRNVRERATGDIQLAQAVASQTVIDSTLEEAFGLGALFTAEDASAVNAWLKGETGRNAARGRALALSVMESAVDTGVPIRGVQDMMNNPVGRKIMRAVNATGAEVAANASAGSAFAASMEAFEDVYKKSAFLPQPVADELNKVINDMLGATRTRNDFGFSSLYKKEVVYGVITPRTGFYFNNTLQDADQLAVAEGLASKEAGRAAAAGALNMVLALPGVSVITGLIDAVRNVKAGTTAGKVSEAVSRIENWLGLAAYGTQAGSVMGRSSDVIDGVGMTGEEMWRIGSEAGVGNTLQSTDVVRTLQEQFDTGLPRWFKTIFTRQTDEIGALITERKRWGAFISVAQRMIDEAGGAAALGRAGVEAKVREAARITTEALMDYSANLHPIERSAFFNIVVPFWAFEKSNMIRTARLMTKDSARLKSMYEVAKSGYKFGKWVRKKEVLAELGSFFLENRDDYGFDVDSMQADDASRATQMREEGKTEEEIQAAMLYPLYQQAVAQAESLGLSPSEVRNFGPYMTDERIDIFNPFLDYNIANPPAYMEPDQFSQYRTPFAIVVGDAKMQSWAIYNDYLDPKNKYGSEDMFTYIQPPDDSNLFALSRAVAAANLMGIAFKGATGVPQEKVTQSLATNTVDLIGNPLGFNPLIQAVTEVVMQSYDKENAVNIAPIRVSPAVGKILKSVNLATLENKVVDVDMQQTEFGSVKTTTEPGYFVPKHIAVGMRAVLPGMVSMVGGATMFGTIIENMADLTTEQDERIRRDKIRKIGKAVASATARSVSQQRVEASAEQRIKGDIARYGMGEDTRRTTPIQAEQVRSEALQRAGEPTAEEVDTKRRFVYTAAGSESGRINESDLRLIALKDGFATEEEMKTLSRYELLDRIKSSKKARSYVRVETARYLSEMTPDVRETVTKNAIDRTSRNIGDGRTFAIVRTLLSERGIDADSMTDEQIRNAARKMR